MQRLRDEKVQRRESIKRGEYTMEQQPWARSKLREELEEIKIDTERALWDEEKEEITSTYNMN
jgi:hypothetical protein